LADTPTVVTLAPKNDVKAAGDAFRRQLPELMENAKAVAQLRRAAYLAYLDAGFSEAQALELCKTLI
jgi:hypothetical protein